MKGLWLVSAPPLGLLWFGFAFGDESWLTHWWSMPAIATLIAACLAWAAYCGKRGW